MKQFVMMAALAGLLAACNPKTPELHFLNWAEYIPQEVVDGFEKQEKVKVIIDTFDEPEAMLAKLQAGADSEYDVVTVPEYYVAQLVRSGVAGPLEADQVPNLANLLPNFASPVYDPGNQHSIPYLWGTTGLAYRADKVSGPVESWAALYDPQAQVGDFFLIGEMRETIGSALRYLGYSYNDTDPAHLEEAKVLLLAAKERSRGFLGGTEGKNRLLGGDAAVVVAYNGDALEAAEENDQIRYVVPREGATIWADALIIPAKAPQSELAHKFLNYLLDARVSAQLSNNLSFASPVAGAAEFLDEDVRTNPAIYPPAEVLAKTEYLADLGEQSQLYDQLWTEIRAR